VELKAWIPFSHVVDPLRPWSTSWSPPRHKPYPSCFKPPQGATGRALRAFRGDAHVTYQGAFRAVRWVDFTVPFDYAYGSTAYMNPRVTATGGQIAVTHLDEIYQWAGHTRACNLQQGHAKSRTWERLFTVSPYEIQYGMVGAVEGIQIGLDTKNPLTPQIATPAINAEVGITSGADGRDSSGVGYFDGIYLHYVTDLFPSYGLEVTADGRTVGNWVISDASCINPVFGFGAAFKIGRGLIQHTNTGIISVGPDGNQAGDVLWYEHADADNGDTTVDPQYGVRGSVVATDIRGLGPNELAPDGLCNSHAYSAFPGAFAQAGPL
jgi:hypothetical protein